MGILPEDVARVRAASDLVGIAGEHIALKRVGRRYQGLCPFHAEKTPSFSVNPAEGLYYCFGCGAKGDVITFVREVEHLDFAEAIERLAARAGLQLRYDDEGGPASAERKRLAALREALGKAVEWYHQRLLSSPDAVPARHYLRAERGYDGDVVRTYRLGWAPEGWDTLVRALRLPADVLRDTGLGFVNRAGRAQDFFRGRLLFPIFDARGDAVGFGGRILPGAAAGAGGQPGPKYQNSPETPVYKKSRVLYGLNWAKGAIVDSGEVVICEGYTDVIGLHLSGVPQAVATCGTSLVEEHVQLLKNFAPRLVLAYDADAAGQAAAERVYEWERKYEIDVAVAALPKGQDPADLARADPAALAAAVKEARPFLGFRLERVLEAADLRTPEGRARAAEAALAVVAEHPSELVRDQYLMDVADRTRIEPDRLRVRLKGGQASVRRAAPGRSVPRPSMPGAEVQVLRVAVHRPDEVGDRLHPELFREGVGRRAYLALAGAQTLHDALAAVESDEAVSDLLQRLAVEDDDPAEEPEVASLAMGTVDRLLAEARRDAQPSPVIPWLQELRAELREEGT
ncbi:MAG TPA: DNA primase, partial [Acidimicrobiales bacterium]